MIEVMTNGNRISAYNSPRTFWTWAAWILLALAMVGCEKAPIQDLFSQKYEPEFACGFKTNMYGQRVSWKQNTPVRFYLHEDVPVEYRTAIEESLGMWKNRHGQPLIVLLPEVDRGPINPRQDRRNVIYWMKIWDNQNRTEQGRTTTYSTGNQITETDIRVNAADFNYFVENSQSARDVHLKSLMVHEFGHALGLIHQDTQNSVMGPNLAPLSVRDTPIATDQQALLCEYGL